MNILVFKLPIATALQEVGSESLLQWKKLNKENVVLDSGQIELSSAHTLCINIRCVFLIPVNYVHFSHVDIKAKNNKQLIKALPYALEEEFSEDIENLHFATASFSRNHPVNVVAINRDLFVQFLQTLTDAKLIPDIVTADIYSIIKRSQTEWDVLVEEGQVLARTSEHAGFSCSLEDLPDYLNMSANDSLQPVDIMNLYTSSSIHLDDGLFSDLQQIDIKINPAPTMTQGLDVNHINLLQQDFASKKSQLNTIAAWHLPIGLTLGLFFMAIASTFLELVYLKNTDAELNANIEKTFIQVFPDTQNIVNPHVQMQQRLREIIEKNNTQPSSFLKLLHHSSHAIIDRPGMVLMNIAYAQSKLSLDIRAPDIQILEKVKSDIHNEQVKAVVQSVNSIDQQVEARIVVEELY